MIAMIKSMTIDEMVMKVQTAVNRCRTELELRDYYRSLDKDDQDMDWIINTCYNRLLDIRRMQEKKDDLLGRN